MSSWAEELAIASTLDESIASIESSLNHIRSHRMKDGVPDTDEHQNLKDALFDAASNYHQMDLMVDRLRLSGGSIQTLVPKRDRDVQIPLPLDKDEDKATNDKVDSFQHRDRQVEITLGLLQQLDVARQQRREAEKMCQDIKSQNRRTKRKLVDADSPIRTASYEKNLIIRHLFQNLITGTHIKWQDDKCLSTLLFELEQYDAAPV